MIARYFGIILAASVLVPEAESRAAEEKPAPAPSPGKVPAAWKEVTVDYPPAPLPEGKVGTAEELKLILEASAELKTERPIQYRRQLLQPGIYRVSIESSGGRNFFFVIAPAGEEPEEDAEEDSDAAGRTPGAAGMGAAEGGDGPRGGIQSAGARDQTGKKRNSRSARKEGEGKEKEKEAEADEARPGGARGKAAKDPAGKGRPGDEESEEMQPDRQGKAAVQGKIRALFRLIKNPKPSNEVLFGVRPVEGGKRFELSVQAGTTLGRATIGFADARKS